MLRLLLALSLGVLGASESDWSCDKGGFTELTPDLCESEGIETEKYRDRCNDMLDACRVCYQNATSSNTNSTALRCQSKSKSVGSSEWTSSYDECLGSSDSSVCRPPLKGWVIGVIAAGAVLAIVCIFCTMFCMPFVVEKRTRQLTTADSSSAVGLDETELAGMHSPMEEQLHRILKQLKSNGFVVPFDQVTLERKIAAGASGQVYRASYLNTPVAVKELFSALINPDDLEEFNREALMLSGLHHPYIMQFFGISYDHGHLYLVTRFYDGTLTDLIASKDYSRDKSLELSSQIGQGMMYLHSKRIVHRDLKPDNILLDATGAKISDFGLAKVSMANDGFITGQLGTPAFMAPEMMAAERVMYSGKVDTYAFGILLWCILHKEFPYEGLNAMQIMEFVGHEGKRPPISPQLKATPQLASLLTRCWHVTPDLRPGFDKIVATLDSVRAAPRRRPTSSSSGAAAALEKQQQAHEQQQQQQQKAAAKAKALELGDGSGGNDDEGKNSSTNGSADPNQVAVSVAPASDGAGAAGGARVRRCML